MLQLRVAVCSKQELCIYFVCAAIIFGEWYGVAGFHDESHALMLRKEYLKP